MLGFQLHLGSVGVERHHLEGLLTLLARADIGAVAAAETVEHGGLNAEVHTLHSLRSQHVDGLALKLGGLLVVEDERTDGSMRTAEGTLVALDTVLRIPLGDESLDATLVVGGGAGIPVAVGRAKLHEVGDLQQVAGLSVHRTDYLLDESGSVVLDNGVVGEVGPCGIHRQLLVLATAVNGCVVEVDDVLALLAIGLDDEGLHLGDGEVGRDDLRDAEEGRLQDGVRAVAETDLLADLRGVDIIDLDVVLGEIALHLVGDEVDELLAIKDGVEQEGATVAETARHIIHVEVGLDVASHEVRRIDLVGGVDGLVAEAEVRAGETTRLLGVVGEVGLAVLVGVVADDLHGVLVGTDGTVRTETVELSLEETLTTHRNLCLLGERGEGVVVDDTHREVVLRLGELEVLIDGEDLGRRGVAGSQSVASADDERMARVVVEGRLDVEVERLALSTRLLRAVEHGDALHGLRQRLAQVIDRERTIEVDSHHTDLLALLHQVVDALAGRLRGRTHEDDDVLGIGSAVVVEEVILAARDLGNLGEVLLHDLRNGVVVLVASLAVGEEGLRVLGRTTGVRTLRGHGAVAETLDPLGVDERTDVLHVHGLHLVVLMGGAESVEEVDKRNLALKRREVGNR